MIQIVYAWAGGWPVLGCLGMLAAAVLAGTWCRRRSVRIVVAVAFVVALTGVVLSAPLIPKVLSVSLLAALAVWCFTTIRPSALRTRSTACVVAVICALTALCNEARFFHWSNVHAGSHQRIVVIGDSVSAGIGGVHERVWPLQLHERLDVDVLNVAAAGARVRDALDRQVPHVATGPALILLEIGGNDLLSRVRPSTFEHDLDALLRAVVQPERLVVMFELPTPPFHARYAAIQRKLAAFYGVPLIPRRYLISIIADPASTLDGAHLSPRGHDRMAEMIAQLLGPSLSTSSTASYRISVGPLVRPYRDH